MDDDKAVCSSTAIELTFLSESIVEGYYLIQGSVDPSRSYCLFEVETKKRPSGLRERKTDR